VSVACLGFYDLCIVQNANEMNDDTTPLTPRETDVLKLIVAGFSTVQIAEQLLISVNTVESHRKALYRKMRVHRIGEAIRVAQQLGL
jgi:DNA-binding CsgD family transcriptional regulator